MGQRKGVRLAPQCAGPTVLFVHAAPQVGEEELHALEILLGPGLRSLLSADVSKQTEARVET